MLFLLSKGTFSGPTILNMLKEKFDVSAVSKVTGLSEAEILAERERAGKTQKNGKID